MRPFVMCLAYWLGWGHDNKWYQSLGYDVIEISIA